MHEMRSYVGLEIIKRLDDMLGGIYSNHIKASSRLTWICRSKPRWILGLDMVRNLADIFADIYICNGLKGLLDGEKTSGITVEDGKTIVVVIKHCLECPFSFGHFCPLGNEYWTLDPTEWETNGYLIPDWCPLQSKTSVEIGRVIMEDSEKKRNIDVHTEVKEVRDIVIKLFADMNALENMGLDEMIGDWQEMDVARALITGGINGIIRALASCTVSDIPEMTMDDIFQSHPIQDHDLGHFLNKLYWDDDEEGA